MLSETDLLLSSLLGKIATAASRHFSEDDRLDCEYTLHRASGGRGRGRSSVTSGLKITIFTQDLKYVIEAAKRKLDVAVVQRIQRGGPYPRTYAKLALSGIPLSLALEVAGSMDETKDYPFLAEVFS